MCMSLNCDRSIFSIRTPTDSSNEYDRYRMNLD